MDGLTDWWMDWLIDWIDRWIDWLICTLSIMFYPLVSSLWNYCDFESVQWKIVINVIKWSIGKNSALTVAFFATGPPVAPKPVPSFKPEFSPSLPVHIEITEQEPLQLETVVQAHPDAEVQWLKNGAALGPSSNITLGREPLASNPQVDRHYLIIENATAEDSGKYTCVAVNPEGLAQTACTVKVNPEQQAPLPPPVVAPKPAKPVISKPLPPKVAPRPGQPLRLEVLVKPNPETEVQWLKNGTVLVANVNILMGKRPVHTGLSGEEDEHFLIIHNPTVADSGEYVCVARNVEGEAVTRCDVVVMESVAVQKAPETVVTPAKQPVAPPPPVAAKPHLEERVEAAPAPPPPEVAPKPVSLFDRKETIRIEETNVYRYEGAASDLEPPRFSELLVDQSVEEGHPLRLKCHVSGTYCFFSQYAISTFSPKKLSAFPNSSLHFFFSIFSSSFFLLHIFFSIFFLHFSSPFFLLQFFFSIFSSPFFFSIFFLHFFFSIFLLHFFFSNFESSFLSWKTSNVFTVSF